MLLYVKFYNGHRQHCKGHASSLTALFHVFECIYSLFLELERKRKVEENNASVPSNIPKVQTSSRNESKHDLGKVIVREQQGNREVQGDTNDSKCRKTETEQATQGNNSLDLTSEQEKGSRNEVLRKDISTQKKRKRCWTCKAKLELAQRELGNCRCGKYTKRSPFMYCTCMMSSRPCSNENWCHFS